MNIHITAFIAFSAALISNMAITPLILYFSHKFKLYDRLDHRKIHKGDIPRLGGIGIFISFIVAIIIPLWVLVSPLSKDSFLTTLIHYLPVFIGILLIHAAGLIDDFLDMRALYKFLIQIAAALIVTLGGFTIKTIIVPFTQISFPLGLFSIPVTVVWMVALSNAVNFVDGMDGLAGGISAIASLFLGITGIISGEFTGAVLSFALLGALIGFLVFNFPPARLFMGDSGALFLGFVLALIPLVDSDAQVTSYSLIPVITLLAIPILDTIGAIIRRIRGRRPISSPDREHLHHKLLDFKLKPVKILVIVYSTNVLLGAVAVCWALLGRSNLGLMMVCGAGTLCVILFILLGRLNKVRKAAHKPITPETVPVTHR